MKNNNKETKEVPCAETNALTADIESLRDESCDNAMVVKASMDRPLTIEHLSELVKKTLNNDVEFCGAVLFVSQKKDKKPTEKKSEKKASIKKSMKNAEAEAKYEERVCTLRQKGWCAKSIANMCHADIKKINKILKKHGLPTATPKASK